MEIMLDTDVLIDAMKGREELPPGNYAISVITLYEVMRGLSDPRVGKLLLESKLRVLPLDNQVLLTASDIYRHLRSSGSMIGEADILIAATAISHNLPLYTKNLRHFSRLTPFGLRLYKGSNGVR